MRDHDDEFEGSVDALDDERARLRERARSRRADPARRSLVELTDDVLRGVVLDDGPDGIARQRWHRDEQL